MGKKIATNWTTNARPNKCKQKQTHQVIQIKIRQFIYE